MFNLKEHIKISQRPYEKYLREENLGPKVEESSSIAEKKLPHRDGFEQTTTEDQMKHDKLESQITEKLLNSVVSKYVVHRSDASELTMPPINALVEKIRKDRRSDREESINPHWSHTFNEKKQQGSLPKWSKNAPQHDKPVLNNDPDRFKGNNREPTKFHNDKIIPLIGDITTADIDRVAYAIKTGQSTDYDNAIGAILRLAHDEGRELTNVERRTVVNLKIARTNKLIKNAQVD